MARPKSKVGAFTWNATCNGKTMQWSVNTQYGSGVRTFTPNPGGKTALMLFESSAVHSSATFYKTSTEAPNTTPAAQTTKEAKSGSVASLPKGAVYLKVDSDADARQTFTSFRYPGWHSTDRMIHTGVCRLEVDQQGQVVAITILKSIGSGMDVKALKTFIHWKAKPGPLRIVDVSWKLSPANFDQNEYVPATGTFGR